MQTSYPVHGWGQFVHGVTVVDTSTPLDTGGKPLFDTNGVWAYLCFE